MSVQNENTAGGESVVLERPSASADECVTAAIQVFMQVISQSGQRVEKLDKTLIDMHIAELDWQISRQLDEVMHHPEFQKVESLWRGIKHTVDRTDFRQNVKVEILDVSKESLRQDFEDSPEIIQSGLYAHTYIAEYDTPGGEPIGAVISSYEFDASAQDVTLLRNISKVSASAHMPFIRSVGPKFFLKNTMIQGYGAGRPVATNDTPEGRALNRRVEISLVPQADACSIPDTKAASQDESDVLTQKMEK